MLDHFHVGNGAVSMLEYMKYYNVLGVTQGFPDHPHRGQATVTYMLEGLAMLSIKSMRSF